MSDNISYESINKIGQIHFHVCGFDHFYYNQAATFYTMLESNWKKKRKNIIWWCHTQNIIIGCRDIPFAFRLNAICQKSTKISEKTECYSVFFSVFEIFSLFFKFSLYRVKIWSKTQCLIPIETFNHSLNQQGNWFSGLGPWYH